MSQNGPEASLYGNAVPPAPPEAPGLMEQLAGVFTEPVALFKRLEATPVWAGALVLLTSLNLILSVLWARKVDVDALYRPAMERNPRMTAEMVESTVATMARLNLPLAVLGGLIGVSAICLLMALIYWFVGKHTAEGRPPSYRHAFSAVAVSSLVGVPRFILLSIVCALKNIGGARPEALSPTSLGFYLDSENLKAEALFHALDIFSLASLVLLYLAARYTLRLKVSGAALCVAISALLMFALPVWGAR